MNYQDQLTLLSDILKNQQAHKFGTEDEFSQIHRLAETLQSNGQLDENMQQMLCNITDYCRHKDDTRNEPPFDHWLQSIEELTLPYPHE
jgi:hypothetical protein